MNEQQIELVKKTWRIFQKIDPLLVGEVFYVKLFADHPSFRRMFTGSKQVQARKIIAMLDMIVSRIDRLEELTEDLRNLAVRHIQYGVKPEYYQPVGIALLWMLEQGLGNDWNNEVEDAWDTCYRKISNIMIEESKVK